ncbi:MAG TPA: glycosyltransferase [Rhizobium sp.]|nr:glycosyltransferase [Rhizobium sp.]
MKWVDVNGCQTWEELGLQVPAVFFQTGWAFPQFNRLGEAARRNGAKVVSMIDNCWKGNLRQWIGAGYFRFKLRRRFRSVWVPGASGRKLCQFLGMPANRIYTGLYGADPGDFHPGPTPTERRPKRFLFVGQLIQRKGVLETLAAFESFRARFPDWELHVIGDGPLRELCANRDGVVWVGFKTSDVIAEYYRTCRCLILASHDEHWGVVVHEAALSGCGLIVSRWVGAAEDLCGANNSVVVPAVTARALNDAMVRVAGWDEARWAVAALESTEKADQFGPRQWRETFVTIVEASAKM